ncbi:MAG TPA: TrbG/VirB9 family P-type conjugative transfer protein [Rhodanobacter sp.]|nr:TrbG/VirB9 family P-type conjugative transfer protein [Rhodanobacter sp.]
MPSFGAEQVLTTYAYAADTIYPVRTGLGITTQVELSPNERILDYSTGFSSGWDLTRRENIFYLKPKNIDVDTNMMVRTATHSYIFELKVVATDWKTLAQARRDGVQYKITFTYPVATSFPREKAKQLQSPAQHSELLPGRSYNFNYDYASKSKAAVWLVPVNVYDDGRFTYLRMNDLKQFPTGDFPAVYMRENERSEDSLVNTTVEGNTIIVHGTYNYLVIRHGNDVVGLRRSSPK